MVDFIQMTIQILFERLQVIGADLSKHLSNDLLFHHNSIICLSRLCNGSAKGRKHGTHIRSFCLDTQRIIRQGIRLNFIDVLLKTGGQRHNQRNTDNTNRTCEGSKECSCLLGAEIIETQSHGGKEGHGGFTHILMLRSFHRSSIHREGVCIINDFTVLDPDDSVRILFSQFRVMGDHHHKPVAGHFLQKFHNLYTGFRIQRAGGFVSQQNIRIID